MPRGRPRTVNTTSLPTFEEEISDEKDSRAGLISSYEPFEKLLTEEEKELIDFLVAVWERDMNSPEPDVPKSAHMESEADSDHPEQQPEVQTMAAGNILELVRTSVLELQAGTPNKTDLVETTCQWVAKLDDPWLIPVAESATFKALADVLGEVATRCRGKQHQQCIRCGEIFVEESNGWSCKKFLDNHYSDDDRAEKLTGVDFSLLKPEIAQNRRTAFDGPVVAKM